MDSNLLLLAVLTVLAVGLIAWSLVPRRAQQRDAVKRRLIGRRGVDEEAALRKKAKETATGELVRKATPVLSRIVMPTSDEEQSHLRLKLASAGFRRPQAQMVFLASKSICGVIGLVLAIVGGLAANLQWTTLLGTAAGCAGLGIVLPEMWLSGARKSRQQRLRHGLPDTLDLLVVSVEAGLGLDAAFKRVGEEMASVHPELSEELRLATMETQMGLRRTEALENMARRTSLDEVRSLVSVVVQAEKFGTSVAKALRNQADALRVKRRQAAEEKAQKTAVKLMIPLVLFIFPAIAVVLGGPAVISALRAYSANPQLGGG
jgi:tight adherence protein C